jgi:hypothetical protein
MSKTRKNNKSSAHIAINMKCSEKIKPSNFNRQRNISDDCLFFKHHHISCSLCMHTLKQKKNLLFPKTQTRNKTHHDITKNIIFFFRKSAEAQHQPDNNCKQIFLWFCDGAIGQKEGQKGQPTFFDTLLKVW